MDAAKKKKIENGFCLALVFGGAAFLWNLDKILLNDSNVVPETNEQKHARFVKEAIQKQMTPMVWTAKDVNEVLQSAEAKSGGVYTLTRFHKIDFAKIMLFNYRLEIVYSLEI